MSVAQIDFYTLPVEYNHTMAALLSVELLLSYLENSPDWKSARNNRNFSRWVFKNQKEINLTHTQSSDHWRTVQNIATIESRKFLKVYSEITKSVAVFVVQNPRFVYA